MNTTIKNLTILAAASPFVAGCVSAPEDIRATYVSPSAYSGADCATLRDERAALAAEIATLEDLQRESRNADIAGAVIGTLVFFPALLINATTDDYESQIAAGKGQLEAMDTKLSSC